MDEAVGRHDGLDGGVEEDGQGGTRRGEEI